MDDVFRALADPGRRKLLDSLHARNGQNLRELCAELDMARQSVSKHLAVLEQAGLVVTMRQGREKLHYLNAAPINEIRDRWISRYDAGRAEALADLKRALEEQPMATETTPDVATSDPITPDITTDAQASGATRPTFVYTTYIRTTPEQLWRGLTDPAFTSRYWDITFDTDWQAGSPMVWHHHGSAIADPDQVVLEYDPYTRLSYTWHTFVPALGEAFGLSDEVQAALVEEPRSKVTFELEDQQPMVKLTVVHEAHHPDDTILSLVREGWPQVLAGLKTLLETGRAPDEPAA